MRDAIIARWREWDAVGIQHLRLTEHPQGITAQVHVIGTEDGCAFAGRFEIACDRSWRARSVSVELLGARELAVTSDGAGSWRTSAGEACPELEGALDVDLPITPFTNTLPVRRLGLQPGQSADIKVVYVRAVLGRIEVDPQRYTCLAPRRYLYQSLDSDFSAEIALDDNDLVIDYPGLFRRLA